VNFHEPPRMYSWTIAGGDGAGAVGVTDDYERALDEVVDALRSAPAGSRGLVHRVSLSFIRTGFVYEGLIARCRPDPAGDVAWDDIPPPSMWTKLAPMFTDPPEILGDGIPPEAIATGLVDIQTHQERLERVTSSSSTDRR
jgi:hypothetical protein